MTQNQGMYFAMGGIAGILLTSLMTYIVANVLQTAWAQKHCPKHWFEEK